MDWTTFWRGYEAGYYAAVLEYEERTFADYIDGGYDMYATDEEDAYDE